MIVNKMVGFVGVALGLMMVATGQSDAVKLIDDLGVEVEIAGGPERIVSLAPSNTELLYALGLGNKVVGVTEVCDFPVEVAKVEKVAGFNSVNLEKIVAVKPDLVLAARGNDIEGIRSLRELGIRVFSLDIQSLQQLVQAVDRVGALCGVAEEAARLRGGLDKRIQTVADRLAQVQGKPRVLWGYWSDPVYTAGPGTMIDDVITQAGGFNVASAAEGAWPQIGLETILSWAPEVIVTTYLPAGQDSLATEILRLQKTDGWKKVPAISNSRLYYIEADWLMRPGPRLVNAYEQLARTIHPQLFKEP